MEKLQINNIVLQYNTVYLFPKQGCLSKQEDFAAHC